MDWHSDALPPREQFSSWREACGQLVYGVTPERQGGDGFRGAIRTRRLGGLDLVDVHCQGHLVTRSAADIERTPSDTYYLYRPMREASWFEQRGRRVFAGRGDIVFADPNIPAWNGTSGDFEFQMWRVPRRMLEAYLPHAGHLPMLHFPLGSAEGALVSSNLDALAAQAERIDQRIALPIAENLVRLVAVVAGIASELRDAGREAVREAALQRAIQYIDRHCADAELSPARAAKALSMSVRKLHLLFGASERTFSAWLQRRRLERARLLLESPAAAERSITDIALSVGFNDVSTFYRAAKAEWGATPGDVRAGAVGR